MITSHFNGLTEAQQERLVILIEECAEVIQAGCKVLRHGYESNNKGALHETNRQRVQRELGDLWHSLGRMAAASDLDREIIADQSEYKAESILPYLHHQGK